MATSSRLSGPGASKRPKVSEPRPAGSMASPSGHSGAGGLSTAEVRWILPGQPDAAMARWFGRYPAGMETREDAYLLHPVLRGLSVKLRGGCLLEVKMYEGSLGILDAAGYARGRIESWRKWSFPFGALGPGDAGPPGWTVVHKRRRITQFRLAQRAAHNRTPAPGRHPGAGRGFGVHGGTHRSPLGRARPGGPWDSRRPVPVGLLRGTLQGTAALFFAQAPPGDVELDLGHCQSYADWLSRRRVPERRRRPVSGLRHPARPRAVSGEPGAVSTSRSWTTVIHPLEGEESPELRTARSEQVT